MKVSESYRGLTVLFLVPKQKHVARRAEGGVVRRGRDEIGLVAAWAQDVCRLLPVDIRRFRDGCEFRVAIVEVTSLSRRGPF